MSCKVCISGDKKYKCPRCLIPYCSVSCWKKHKEDKCEKIESNDQPNENEHIENASCYKYKTDSSVSLEKLKLLEGSQGLKNILINPHVRNMLLSIDKSKHPAEAMDKAMLEPIFVEFADECLKIVEPSSEP